MNVILSPLTDFAQMILQYFIGIWDFLLFVGGSASVIIVLIGAIMAFVQVKVGKLTGWRLIMSGIILAIVIVYFSLYPPDFSISRP
ncbi:MAG: hypothetical protein ACXAEF_15575 [Candidatus Thorarchaeota archaeon]|jgi:hypothetical protein